MHIVDGVLTTQVLLTATAISLVGVGIGLQRLQMEKIPTAGVLAALFFVASLIHVPLGVSSVHLVMNGLAGLILGFAAFPVFLVGLLLQAVLFGFGGITVLGVNTLNIALPAVVMYYLSRHGVRHRCLRVAALWAGIAGAGAIALTGGMIALMLYLSGEGFWLTAKLVLIAHIPVMIIEGILCAAVVVLLRKVKPEILQRGI